jgi:hypothetical protein
MLVLGPKDTESFLEVSGSEARHLFSQRHRDAFVWVSTLRGLKSAGAHGWRQRLGCELVGHSCP